MAIELELTAPAMALKASMAPAPTPVFAALSIRCTPLIPYMAGPSSPPIHSKEKAKAMEENNDNENEATQVLREKLENFVVPITENEKSKALIAKLEQMGAKRAFKSKETVESDSNEEQEEKRVQTVKKNVKEPIGTNKEKEAVEMQMMVALKMPMAGPSHPISKPVVLIPSAPKSVPKAPIVSTTSVAGPSTLQSSAPKTIATAPKPVSVTLTVRQFKLAGTEESGMLIINQATEVSAGKVADAAMQETFQSDEDTGNKNDDGKGNNDNEGNNDNNATMNIDTDSLVVDTKFLESLHLKKAYQGALTKARKAIKDIALSSDYKSLYNSKKIVQALIIGTTKHVHNMKRWQEC
ncbi:hypothetical protein C0995_000703 [Termitomyces sp. Mi166|nr:hypothetical protein C0995_000703 [Termitomyces sp. Mi166\